MSKKAVVWIRDDFRIKNNSALSYATNNYDTVTALYIYNKENFDDVREAQKWWVSTVSYTHLTLPTIYSV